MFGDVSAWYRRDVGVDTVLSSLSAYRGCERNVWYIIEYNHAVLSHRRWFAKLLIRRYVIELHSVPSYWTEQSQTALRSDQRNRNESSRII